MSSPFPVHVENKRLRYEPLHESVDVLSLYDYHRTGEMNTVMRPLGEKPHATPKKSMDVVVATRDQWESHDLHTYSVSQAQWRTHATADELATIQRLA